MKLEEGVKRGGEKRLLLYDTFANQPIFARRCPSSIDGTSVKEMLWCPYPIRTERQNIWCCFEV
jgi:hypothetical protein